MAQEKQIHLEKCAHCGGTGTCASGPDGQSCAKCSKRFVFFKYSPSTGLVCSVCKGEGHIEPMGSRFIYRTGPMLAIYIMATAIMIIIFGTKEHFSEVLAFLGTLTGAVTGFYFGRKE